MGSRGYLTVKHDTRTEEQKIIDKLLMLKIIDECKKKNIEINEEKLMNLIYIIQTVSKETFHYKDWEWEEEIEK